MILKPEELEMQQLEAIIERGLQGFCEAGQALCRIRDKRLYRLTYRKFEDYCRERWSISKTRAYELMAASEVVAQLSAVADDLPANEAQARPLTLLNESARPGAWAVAQQLAGGAPTAKHVARAAMGTKQQQPELEIGQRVTVASPKSPFHGAIVTVVTIDGAIVRASTATGDEPFLITELTPKSAPIESIWTARASKGDRMEALEATLQAEQVRVAVLESLLKRMVRAARLNQLHDGLLSEAEGLL